MGGWLEGWGGVEMGDGGIGEDKGMGGEVLELILK